jgi:hypothetical protein
MIWMDVDAALSEVPVNVAPLTDDSDFKSVESAVAYNASGMALYWHFVTPDGNYTVTQVTPTTGGTYDWAHQNQGMYTIEIPASGGASINNNTEGWGFFTGYATGVLPWRGPTIGFRAAGLNNLLVEDAYSATRGLAGTALPNAAAEASGGLPTLSAAQASNGTINANVHRWLTGTPNALQSGRVDSYLGAAAAGVIAAATFAANALDAVWSTTTRLLTAGTNIVLAKGTGLTGLNDLSAAAVNSEVDTALADYDAPTNAEMTARTLAAADYATAANLATVDTVVDAIKVVTDILATMYENSSGYRWTEKALEEAPSGGGGGSGDWTADEKTAIRTILGVPGSGTTPTTPSAGALFGIAGQITTVDGIVDAIVAKTNSLTFTSAGKVDANVLEMLAAVANKVADHVRRRTQANVEASSDGDALSLHSEYGLIQTVHESSTEDNAGELTVYRTDGSTELGRRTLDTDPDAEPITGVS